MGAQPELCERESARGEGKHFLCASVSLWFLFPRLFPAGHGLDRSDCGFRAEAGGHAGPPLRHSGPMWPSFFSAPSGVSAWSSSRERLPLGMRSIAHFQTFVPEARPTALVQRRALTRGPASPYDPPPSRTPAEAVQEPNRRMPASRHPDPRFKEIARERVSDRVARELMRLIADGRLAPGERLPGERELASLMGVSRVSVRAALQQLKARGLLSAVQGGGTRLLSTAGEIDPGLSALIRVDAANLHDLAEIRASLETWAARRAALRATPAQRAENDALYARMADPARAGRYKAADDVAFHLAIAKAAASPVYLHLLSTLRDILTAMLDYHRYELFGAPADDAEILCQHGAIAAAIQAGDGEAAADAMRAHLGWVLEHYESARRRQVRRIPQAAQ